MRNLCLIQFMKANVSEIFKLHILRIRIPSNVIKHLKQQTLTRGILGRDFLLYWSLAQKCLTGWGAFIASCMDVLYSVGSVFLKTLSKSSSFFCAFNGSHRFRFTAILLFYLWLVLRLFLGFWKITTRRRPTGYNCTMVDPHKEHSYLTTRRYTHLDNERNKAATGYS